MRAILFVLSVIFAVIYAWLAPAEARMIWGCGTLALWAWTLALDLKEHQ